MCNCGNKRGALRSSSISRQPLSSNRQIPAQRQAPTAMPAPSPAISNMPVNAVAFKYNGNGFLNVRSLSGRIFYRFSRINRVLTINPEDVQMMQRYSDLEQIKE